VLTEVCGDGKVMLPSSTYCDDGNSRNGDGCTSTCGIEPGWTCTLGTSSTASTCSEICGDGIIFDKTNGKCDDGNVIDGDGCSSRCVTESNWSCTGGDSTKKDTCRDVCGDGKVMLSSSTYCDDGNSLNNDGCTSACGIETGWTCTLGSATTASICSEICGDGIIYDKTNSK